MTIAGANTRRIGMRELPLKTETRTITVVELHDRLSIEDGRHIEIVIGRVIVRLVIVAVEAIAAAAALGEAGRALVARAKKL